MLASVARCGGVGGEVWMCWWRSLEVLVLVAKSGSVGAGGEVWKCRWQVLKVCVSVARCGGVGDRAEGVGVGTCLWPGWI